MSVIAGIETSSARSSVAIARDASLAERFHEGARGHVEFVVPALLDLAGSDGLQSLDAIAVGIGPGLFTGLRVGVQTAKTLAATLDLPLVAVSSLEALAYASSEAIVLAAVQAHRGEVFAALFKRHENGLERLSEDASMSPAQAAKLAIESGAVVAGNAPAHYAEEFAEAACREADATATAVVHLARASLAAGDTADALTVEPAYLRRSEAELKWGNTGVVAKRPDRVQFRGERA